MSTVVYEYISCRCSVRMNLHCTPPSTTCLLLLHCTPPSTAHLFLLHCTPPSTLPTSFSSSVCCFSRRHSCVDAVELSSATPPFSRSDDEDKFNGPGCKPASDPKPSWAVALFRIWIECRASPTTVGGGDDWNAHGGGRGDWRSNGSNGSC
jgi:hypothetical protein